MTTFRYPVVVLLLSIIVVVAPAARGQHDPVDQDAESGAVVARPKSEWYREPVFYYLMMLQLAGTLVMKPQTPLLGAKAARNGITSESMGVILALMPLSGALVSPWIGQLLPRIGLRRTLALGSITMALSGAAFGVLDFLHGPLFVFTAIVLRILFGFGQATGMTATAAYWNAACDSFSTVHAVTTAFSTLTGMLVPPACSLIEMRFGYYMAFIVFGLVSALIVAFCTITLPDLKEPAPSSSCAGLGAVRRIPRALAALAVVVANMAAAGLIGVLLPYVFADLGVSDIGTSLAFSASGLAWTAGSLLSSRMLDGWRCRASVIMNLYTVLAALALVMLALVKAPLSVAASVILLSFSTATGHVAACNLLITEALAYDTALVPVATGLKISARAFGEAIGNLFGGLLYSHGGLALANWTFVSLTIAAIIAYEVTARWAGNSPHTLPEDDLAVPLLNNRKPELLGRLWRRLRGMVRPVLL